MVTPLQWQSLIGVTPLAVLWKSLWRKRGECPIKGQYLSEMVDSFLLCRFLLFWQDIGPYADRKNSPNAFLFGLHNASTDLLYWPEFGYQKIDSGQRSDLNFRRKKRPARAGQINGLLMITDLLYYNRSFPVRYNNTTPCFSVNPLFCIFRYLHILSTSFPATLQSK